MSTPSELLSKSLDAFRNANRIDGTRASYRKDNPSEYASVMAYLDGGTRPGGTLTLMGQGFVLEEDARRALAALPPPAADDWFGLPDPWAGVPFGSRPEGPPSVSGGAVRLSGDLGGRKIGGYKFTNRPPGVNVIAIENGSNFTIEDVDGENVPIIAYLYGCRNWGVRRIRAKNIYGPFKRTGFHCADIIQAVNCEPPHFVEDLKLEQPDAVPTAPGTYDPGSPGYWGTEDIFSMFGTCRGFRIKRVAFNGGLWQSWSGTGVMFGDSGQASDLQLDQFVLVNPGRVALAFFSSNMQVTNGRIWQDRRRFNSAVDGRLIESVGPVHVQGGVTNIRLGGIQSHFENGSGGVAGPGSSFVDLGGNDWDADLDRDELRALCRV